MPNQDKENFIKRLTDKGMTLSDATEEWGIYLAEIDAYKELASKKENKKAIKAKRKIV